MNEGGEGGGEGVESGWEVVGRGGGEGVEIG